MLQVLINKLMFVLVLDTFAYYVLSFTKTQKKTHRMIMNNTYHMKSMRKYFAQNYFDKRIFQKIQLILKLTSFEIHYIIEGKILI